MKTLKDYSEIINATEDCNAEAISMTELKDAALVVFTFGNFHETTAAVIYDDGTIFTPWDWQAGGYPETPDEIGDYKWREGVSANEAVVMDGLPRLF